MEQENFGITSKIQALLWGTLVLVCLLVTSCLRQFEMSNMASWSVGLLVVLAAAVTIVSLNRELPLQNILIASTLIAATAPIVQAVIGHGGFYFGRYIYSKKSADELLNRFSWIAPLLWVVIVLNARGVARLIMHSARRTKNYGIWTLGLTLTLVMLWQFSFQPITNNAKENWSWKSTDIYSGWYGTPWYSFLEFAALVLVILLLITPNLINKSAKEATPSVQPLFVWLLLNWLVLTGAWVHQLSGVLLSTLGQTALTAMFAVHGSGLWKGTAKR